MTSLKNKKRLAQYSSAALFIAAASETNAQVQYTDVDPDVVVNAPGGQFDLDLNNDDITDFVFSASSANAVYITSFGANNFYVINAVFGNPLNANSIAGTASGEFVYPYAILEDISIGSGVEFHNNSFQSLAYNFYGIISSVFYYPIFQGGNWFGGETNKYIGLKLEKDGSTYYGWLRMDVFTNNKGFLIKDYAVEAAANTAITTDSSLNVGIQEIQQEDHFSAFVSDKILHLQLNYDVNSETLFNLFDLSGKLLYQEALSEQETIIDLHNLAASSYIIQIISDHSTFSKKIIL